jgi:hypothetical protein
MTSMARHIVLRSTGPHRNISHVFRGQLRHIHQTAEKPKEKPVFRWEVRIFVRPTPVQFCLDSKWRIEPIGPFGT